MKWTPDFKHCWLSGVRYSEPRFTGARFIKMWSYSLEEMVSYSLEEMVSHVVEDVRVILDVSILKICLLKILVQKLFVQHLKLYYWVIIHANPSISPRRQLLI